MTTFSMRHSLMIASVLCLTACASSNGDVNALAETKAVEPKSEVAELCVSPRGQLVECQPMTQVRESADQNYDLDSRTMQYTHPLEASDSTVLLGDYIEQMATEILHNLTIPLDEAVVGVTSFVEFSEDLASVNHFGNMLAENFIYELQQNGIPVVDYKVAGAVTVTPLGDFVFSRNPDRLNLTNSMSYVLTGTMTYNKRGLILNARMVNYDNKRVVASSKKIIPYFVLDSIIPSSEKHIVADSE